MLRSRRADEYRYIFRARVEGDHLDHILAVAIMKAEIQDDEGGVWCPDNG